MEISPEFPPQSPYFFYYWVFAKSDRYAYVRKFLDYQEHELRGVWFGRQNYERKQKKEKKVTIEEVTEETGKLVGKSIKKGFGIAKSFAKGTEEAITEKKKEKK